MLSGQGTAADYVDVSTIFLIGQQFFTFNLQLITTEVRGSWKTGRDQTPQTELAIATREGARVSLSWDACKSKISVCRDVFRGLVLLNLVFDVIYSSVWRFVGRQQGLVVVSKLEVSGLDGGVS